MAQGLLDLKLPAGKPIAILSDNALDHLVLATLHIGRPVCTVCSGYCRLAQDDYSRIHGILRTLDPCLVYASDAALYGPPLAQAGISAVEVFSTGHERRAGALKFARLAATPESAAVMAAFEAITPDMHAKYLLTSGSTGQPNVVINTHRMLCANQQMLAQTLRFLQTEKPVLLDWLPWSHTFGGNHNVNLVLKSGGKLYIDEGRPLPGAIERTLAHLRQVQPTVYFNVPRGYEMLLPALEADAALARQFFGRLCMLFYAGAGMPVSTWRRLEAAAARVRDDPLWMTTSWGSTETAPAVTFASWRLPDPGVIGLPLPGVALKFVPNGGKLEMRVRGDNVFPSYRDNPEATRVAFDEEGYYRIGDAGHLFDDADPLQGVVFNGRVAEDFKLGIEYLFMAVLGGVGSVWGAFTGAALVKITEDQLQVLLPKLIGTAGSYEIIVFGVALVMVLKFAPDGVWPVFECWLPKPQRSGDLGGASPLAARSKPQHGELLLEVQSLRKAFGGLVAVNDVSFAIRAGDIVGRIGPDGAGKSTTFNLISGVLPLTSGRVLLRGQPAQGLPSREVARRGISRTFQHVKLVPDMSMLENVALGTYLRTRSGSLAAMFRLNRAEERRALHEAERQLQRVGPAAALADDPRIIET